MLDTSKIEVGDDGILTREEAERFHKFLEVRWRHAAEMVKRFKSLGVTDLAETEQQLLDSFATVQEFLEPLEDWEGEP